MFLLLMP